jgi:hypothetical protein
MAASNKPTAVHFTAVFFGMTTLILGVTTYLGYKERGEALSQLQAKTDEAANATTGLNGALGDIDEIKAQLGYQANDVDTMMAQLGEDLTRYGNGKEGPDGTVSATLAAMRSTIDQQERTLAEKDQQIQGLNTRLASLEEQYKAQMAEIAQSQQTSETSLQDFIKNRDELLAQKQQELDTLRADYNREQREKAQLTEQMNRMRRDLGDQIANLERVNRRMKDELDGIKKVSFEVADGEITNVDNTSRTVWINLGEDDRLRPQVTFSVYDQNNYGVARGAEDVKGSVEVVRVLGPKLSEARILSEQLDRPFAPGDVVYSPIWTPGLVEQFAFVGEIDFEGDGQSDRQQLHDLLQHANAKISVEVDDEGNRNPPEAKIDVHTKFLVIGHIPDQAQFAAQDPELERVKRMNAERAELEKEAQQQGVRVVRLNDFLAYMGYKPQQRLFLPGAEMPYTIRGGSRQTGTVDSVGRSGASSGNTSEVYRRNRNTGRQYDN